MTSAPAAGARDDDPGPGRGPQLRHDDDLPDTAKKLLSFTDNRQDASLQAGHFNDFVEVGLIRSALFRALAAARRTACARRARPGRCSTS